MYNRWLLAILFLLLFVGVGYFGTLVISSISGEFYLNNPVFHLLFILLILTLIFLFVLFIRNLVLSLFPHFRTNLKAKIFVAFSLLVLGPALLTVFLSSSVVNRGLDRLLKIQVKRIVNLSQETSRSFLDFLAEDMHRKLKQLRWKKVYPYTLKAYGIDGFLKKEGKNIETVGKFPLGNFNIEVVSKLKEIHYFDPAFGGLIACLEISKATVCAFKELPEELVEKLRKNRELYNNYESLVNYQTPIKALYTSAFILLGIAVIFGALWFARYFERQISIPIEALYRATTKISEGNFNVKIEEKATDELEHVIKAFNYMTEQLKALRHSLEESKRYMEEIINNISSAVITFSRGGKLIAYNKSARRLLNISEEKQYLWEVLSKYPSLRSAVEKLLIEGERRAEVVEEIGGTEKHLSVEIITSPEIPDKLLIIEDITDIVKAQKVQAWKEVAQRLAHEIKNPLTPISLNAERLRQAVKKGKENAVQVVEKSVNAILEQVEIIRRLIDEFRRFARLPLPEKKLVNLNHLVREVLDAYVEKVRIVYRFEDLPEVYVDPQLMKEVFVNLIQNSMEAGAKSVEVSTTTKSGKVFIVFKDDGPGIPEEIAEKVFLPSFSSKGGCRGFGLAIVKKIVEDHGGRIYTIDSNTFVIELPV